MTNNPNAFVSVPREPTEEMIEAGDKCCGDVCRFGGLYQGEVYKAMLAAAPSAPVVSGEEWLPIETAPKDGTTILLARRDDYTTLCIVGWWYGNIVGKWWVDNLVGDEGYELDADWPTHWRPLPAPPGQARPAVSGEEELRKALEELLRYLPDIVKNAMLVQWNEICADTECHPLDIKQDFEGDEGSLGFEPAHWAQAAGNMVTQNVRDFFAADAGRAALKQGGDRG